MCTHNFDLHYMTFFEEAMGIPQCYTFTDHKKCEHPATFLIVRPYNSHLRYNMKLIFVVISVLFYFGISNAQQFSQHRLWRGNGNGNGNNNEIVPTIAFGERSRNFFGVAGILNIPKKFKLPRRNRKCLEWFQQPITNRWKCVQFDFTEN